MIENHDPDTAMTTFAHSQCVKVGPTTLAPAKAQAVEGPLAQTE